MENVEAIAAIIGIINGVRLVREPDKTGFFLFLGAVIVGLVFGYMHWFGLTGLEMGLVAALASSGLYRVAEKVGSRN
jgi:NO-binding membrane sensor protein with MHYT domain